MFCLLTGLTCLGQPADQDNFLKAAQARGQEYATAVLKGDFGKAVDMTHPAAVAAGGGKKKLVERHKRSAEGLKKDKVKMLAYEVLPADEVHKAEKDLLVVLPTKQRFESPRGKLVRDDHLIAVSGDGGKTWLLVENSGEEEMVKVLPHWPKELELPPPGEMEEDTGDPKAGVYTFQKANFKAAVPKGWTRMPSRDSEFQLILQKDEDQMLISGVEDIATPEEVLAELMAAQKGRAKVKELRRAKVKVAGVEATLVRLDIRFGKDSRDVWMTVFQNQGIIYRVFGVGAKSKSSTLEADYQALLGSFAFVGERKDWLASREGKPARTAFLAGLASIELNRPRWKETTFDRGSFGRFSEADKLDELHFEAGGGVWIQIAALDQKTDAKAELEDLQRTYAQQLEKFHAKRVLLRGPKGLVSGLEMTGSAGPRSVVVFGAAFLKGGVAVHLSLGCPATQQKVWKKDWEQLLRGFRLEDAAGKPPLFSLRRQEADGLALHPTLAKVLKKAVLVYPEGGMTHVHGISPDGQRALISGRDGLVVETLADRKRIQVEAPEPPASAVVAWSRDGKNLAFATHGGLVRMTIGVKADNPLPLEVVSLAFLPDQALLLAVKPRPEGDIRRRYRPEGRFVQQRLARLDEDSEAPKTLLEFPLARFANLAVAPDGKRLALVTNRDHPRTSPRPGHLYIANVDGTGLRQLTKDPEIIRSVAWSEDGRSLYTVLRRTPDADGLDAGSSDLYKISAETGAAANLSRCGRIESAWVQGDALLLRTAGPDLPASQRGIFKVGVMDLEKLAAENPGPKGRLVADAGRAIAASIKAALAPRRLAEVVPTPELMEKLAGVFAKAASEALALPFDFSPASLDSLAQLPEMMERELVAEPALLLGLGAYYGETLRKVAKAKWRLGDMPLGDWRSARIRHANAVAQVVLPFSDTARFVLLGSHDIRATSATLVLVYPAGLAEQALREATSPNYAKAQNALDCGDLNAALALLTEEMCRSPNNVPLAREVLDLCSATEQKDAADQFARLAVEAGSAIPELLVRRADALVKSAPDKAMLYYRKAAQAGGAPSFEIYLKLGKQLKAQGQQPLAECCFRRAHELAESPEQQEELRTLMGMPEERRLRRR
jgi:hypothetical protein